MFSIFYFLFFIFDRSNLFLNQLKLQLKFWFESALFNQCSIAIGSIKCNFRSIKSVFLSIENRSESFLKTSFLHVFFIIQIFSKTFSLSLFDRSKSSQLLSFSLKLFQRFLSFKAGKTLLPLLFHLFSCFLHFREKFEPMKIWGFWCFQSFLSKLINGFLLRDDIKLIFVI